MAAKEAPAPAKEAPGAKAKKKPPIVVIIVGVLLALLLAGGAKMVLGGGKKTTGEEKEKKAAIEVGVSMQLDEFLVNLAGGQDHYLRTTIALGLKKGLTEEQEKEHVAPIRDTILTVLSSKSLKDLDNLSSRDALKEQLRTKINDAIGEEAVGKVYFTAFATQ